MISIQSVMRNKRRIRSIRILTPIVLFLSIFWICGSAAAEESENGGDDGLWYAITHGKPTLNARLRVEFADQTIRTKGVGGSEQSEAYTLRTRLGYGTKPWHGVMVYAEAENTTAVATSQYRDTTEVGATGQTVIADPINTEVNQAFLKVDRKDWLDTKITLGRQRMVLGDARFIGNVGWRQNEQTYDAVRGSTSLGVEDLNIMYAYQRYARRIFGDQGPAAKRDWRSNNHIINATYTGIEGMKVTAFVYLLDLHKSGGNSSASYGMRLTGASAITEKLKLLYEASYGYQTDHANNPVDYDAHYVMAQLKLAASGLGVLGMGYELLGSDNGMARFVTPLATAHKFNGWADVFLDNGGTDGLQDLFATFSPKLPCGFSGSLVYHHFWSDEGANSLGDEIDIVLKRPINKYLDLLAKSAYFNSSDRSRPNIWRIWLQAVVHF